MMNTMIVKSHRSIKLHYFVITDKKIPKQSFKVDHLMLNGIDILGEGSIDVLPPSIHPSGIRYCFVKVDGDVLKPLTITKDEFNELIRRFEELSGKRRGGNEIQETSRVSERKLSEERINRIVEVVKPYWRGETDIS